jgi:hypothetical protein
MRKPDRPTPRQVLSANLQALMAARSDRNTIKKVADAVSGLSNGKVGRIYAGTHTTDIDTLQSLAEAFDLEPWQLMVEGLNPEQVPSLSTTPLLEQIKSLVSSQETVVRTDEARNENELTESSSAIGNPRKASGRTRKPGSTLDRVTVVGTKSRTKPDVESRPAKGVSKSRTR